MLRLKLSVPGATKAPVRVALSAVLETCSEPMDDGTPRANDKAGKAGLAWKSRRLPRKACSVVEVANREARLVVGARFEMSG